MELKRNQLLLLDQMVKSQFVNHLTHGGVVC